MRASRRRLTIRSTAATAALCLGLVVFGFCRAEEQLYYFIDELGVKHYSNMRLEPRYQPLVRMPELVSSGPSTPSEEADDVASEPSDEYVEDDIDVNVVQGDSK